LYYPFALVNKRIPHKITRKLFADKLVSVITIYQQPIQSSCDPIAEFVLQELDDGAWDMVLPACDGFEIAFAA